MTRTIIGQKVGSLSVYAQTHGISFTDLRVHDNYAALLPAAAAADDLGITQGTFGTDSPQVDAGDVKATSSTRYALFHWVAPASWVKGTKLIVRIHAGMETTVSDTSCTVDVEAFRMDGTGSIDATDLCTTAATDINSLTAADKDFTLTSTAIEVGDQVQVRVAIIYVDGASGTAVTPTIYDIKVISGS